jgi:hypothetical protein
MPRQANKRLVRTVRTDSTHPAKGLFKKSAKKIAASLASRRVSPKGPPSGMHMLTYFITEQERASVDRDRRNSSAQNRCCRNESSNAGEFEEQAKCVRLIAELLFSPLNFSDVMSQSQHSASRTILPRASKCRFQPRAYRVVHEESAESATRNHSRAGWIFVCC